MENEYGYENNQHIMDVVLDELMLARTIQEITDFDKAVMMVFLSMFPTVNPQADIIEKMFKDYCEDYTVRVWYESLFKIPIEKIV
jgi:hypothetical protein